MMHETDIKRIMDRDLDLIRRREWERADRMIWRQTWLPRLYFLGVLAVGIPALFWLFR